MSLNKQHIGTLIVGLGFLTLGLLQLFSLLDWVSLSTIVSIYNTVLPLLIIFAGVYIVFVDDPDQHKKVGGALIVVGVVVLLARYDVIRWKALNGIIGAVLVITGTALLTLILSKSSRKLENSKEETKE